MSVYCIVNARQKLHDTTRKVFLNEPLMYNNNLAHCFRLTLMADNGTDPADLTGVSVSANFLRPDRNTVALEGTITDNVVEVVLPNACYASVGRYKLTVDIGEGSGSSAATRTALIVEGITERNVTDAYVDPGTIMPSINTLIQEINDARDSIPADYDTLLDSIAQTFSDTTAYNAGDYVWHGDLADGGKLYRFTEDHAAGAWTGTDVVEAVVTDGVEGDVRYDAAQTLTDAQKAQARGNIGAASAGTLEAVGHLVDYGAYTKNGSASTDGMTVNRVGTNVTINGTNTNSSWVRFRLYDTMSVKRGGVPSADANKSGGALLKAGHTYNLRSRLLSGTFTQSSTTTVKWGFSVFFAGTTTLWDGTNIVRTDEDYMTQYTAEEDKEACIWFYIPSGSAFSNAVFEVWLEDVTAVKSRDAAIATPDMPVAKSAHSEGDLIMVGGRLLQATSAIEVGDSISTASGGNATETSVVAQIAGQVAAEANARNQAIADGIAAKAVRYDAAQELTVAQQWQSRTNIDAASGGLFDAMNGLVDYGAKPAYQTGTRDGLACTIMSNRVTLNGTNGNGSALRYRLYANIGNEAGSVAAASNIAGGPTLKAGHVYRTYGRMVSGTYTPATTSNWRIQTYKYNTSTVIGTIITREKDLCIEEIRPTEDMDACLWIASLSGDSFSNCVFYVWLVDETVRNELLSGVLGEYNTEENEAWGE